MGISTTEYAAVMPPDYSVLAVVLMGDLVEYHSLCHRVLVCRSIDCGDKFPLVVSGLTLVQKIGSVTSPLAVGSNDVVPRVSGI